jgi:tripeptide aminopeptidase
MKFNIKYTCLERFLGYVQIDTQSDPESAACPSTEKQKNLAKLLVSELHEMGVEGAHLDEFGYVYATIESNTDKKVPVICFCSHMDTSPETSGANVKPVLHKNYDGRDIILPGDTSQVLKQSEHPELQNQHGNDIVTSDGTTLLGADNKAGLAEIMDAVNFLVTNPGIKHGKIRILFTPDEEIGRGADKADMKKLGADFGYTIDGDRLGEVEDETFSADSVTITIHGVITHPGSAKDKMENALKIAAEILERLPKDSLSPETTSAREGFIHPLSVSGGVEKTIIKFIIRDFEDEGLIKMETYLENITKEVLTSYINSRYEFIVQESYRNMKTILNKYPHVTEYALEAVRRSGVEPKKDIIRGGTDGSRFSFMGLPCPNIFAGEHAIHSKKEWISVRDMQKAVETIINLAVIWQEKS